MEDEDNEEKTDKAENGVNEKESKEEPVSKRNIYLALINLFSFTDC